MLGDAGQVTLVPTTPVDPTAPVGIGSGIPVPGAVTCVNVVIEPVPTGKEPSPTMSLPLDVDVAVVPVTVTVTVALEVEADVAGPGAGAVHWPAAHAVESNVAASSTSAFEAMGTTSSTRSSSAGSTRGSAPASAVGSAARLNVPGIPSRPVAAAARTYLYVALASRARISTCCLRAARVSQGLSGLEVERQTGEFGHAF